MTTTVVWETGQFEVDANELLAGSNDETPRNEAIQWLRELLANGRVRASEVKRLAKENGIAPRTLDRAKKRVGASSEHEGIGAMSFWYWRLKDET